MSTSDVYTVTLTAVTSGLVFTPVTPVANHNGTYTSSFMFTVADTYTLQVKLGSISLSGSPITGIKVMVGKAQAMYSQLVSSQSPLVAGHNYTFEI